LVALLKDMIYALLGGTYVGPNGFRWQTSLIEVIEEIAQFV